MFSSLNVTLSGSNFISTEPIGPFLCFAIINDATLVKKTHPFFVNADNGDVLIVYQSAGEAILYRPSTDKLVSVGSIYKLRAGSQKDTQETHINTSTIQSKSASTTKQTQQATTSTSSK